ncbi:uncharacterized protein LOC135497889 [Lineus longissimus]|uniref:uncharacterized protein LOC135497889 n=1 Tax=Lineus longissimus TaxID=88925 RepID=UPI002B4DFA60
MAQHPDWLEGCGSSRYGSQVDCDNDVLNLVKAEGASSASKPSYSTDDFTALSKSLAEATSYYSQHQDVYPGYYSMPSSDIRGVPGPSSPAALGVDKPSHTDSDHSSQEAYMHRQMLDEQSFMEPQFSSPYHLLPFQHQPGNINDTRHNVYNYRDNHVTNHVTMVTGAANLTADSYQNLQSNRKRDSIAGNESSCDGTALSSLIKQELHDSQNCRKHPAPLTGIKREYEDDSVMNDHGIAMKWAAAFGHHEMYQRDYPGNAAVSPYSHQESYQAYGIPQAHQGQWSQHQHQWEHQQVPYPDQKSVSPQRKYKKRTNTIDPNAERIRQENMMIEKYVRTFDSVGSISDTFLHIENQLNVVLDQIQFVEPVTHTYNPTRYAHEPHEDYVRKYCNSRKEILFIGMNPGPFGMAQNGVPFGEINLVKDWLKVEGRVEKPAKEHPQRPILGFDCTRSEVSGSRFWGMFRRICGTADEFFRHSFVHNYCPLALMSKTGKNITPPQLAKAHAGILTESCDQALCDVVKLLGVRVLIGIGKYAQERARLALRTYEPDLQVDVQTLLHPSPINPSANKGWEPVAEKQLQDMGVYHMIASDNRATDNQVTFTELSDRPSSGTAVDNHVGAHDDHVSLDQHDTQKSSTGLPFFAGRPTEVCKSPFDDA